MCNITQTFWCSLTLWNRLKCIFEFCLHTKHHHVVYQTYWISSYFDTSKKQQWNDTVKMRSLGHGRTLIKTTHVLRFKVTIYKLLMIHFQICQEKTCYVASKCASISRKNKWILTLKIKHRSHCRKQMHLYLLLYSHTLSLRVSVSQIFILFIFELSNDNFNKFVSEMQKKVWRRNRIRQMSHPSQTPRVGDSYT